MNKKQYRKKGRIITRQGSISHLMSVLVIPSHQTKYGAREIDKEIESKGS